MASFEVGDIVYTTTRTCTWTAAHPEHGPYDAEDVNVPEGPLVVEETPSNYPNDLWVTTTEAITCWRVPRVSCSTTPIGVSPTSTHASLERVFALAVAQSRDGKGADRHSNGKPFSEQPIVRDIAELGSNHGAIAQVRKKALESTRLAATGRKDMAMAELLGAMVYAGAAYLILEAEWGESTATS